MNASTSTCTGFFRRLEHATAEARLALMDVPFVRHAQAGQLDSAEYRAFLEQAYHHVKHTVPLLMAAGARLHTSQRWALDALTEYVAEEAGHDLWVLDDLAAAGGDARAAREGSPAAACELMVAYAYDCVERVNPLALFGMVHVLEGTSVVAATRAADAIQAHTGLPDSAFRYLRSHGALDVEHVGFFEELMDRVAEPDDQRAIVHAAQRFYALYADIFRALPSRGPQCRSQEDLPHVA
ncbi:MAG: biliverdin-producing heme oxygenase [Planctomycetota bacterium]|nr:MAG: biliverdin-producing heme oxygenase [Planctomycetota bacterium]